MKKINYLYYIMLLAMWPIVDYIIGIGTRKNKWFLILLPLYVSWFIFSPALFYEVNKKSKLKETFICSFKYEAQWCMLWFDRIHGELAVLYMFNPFKVQYFGIDRITSIRVQTDALSKDKKYAGQISCVVAIENRNYKIAIITRGRGYMISMDRYGNNILKQLQRLVDEILETKQIIEENK